MAGKPFAIVRPRVFSSQTGEVLLLEDGVAAHLAAGDRGVVEIIGRPLMGKSTAIEYLDQVFADETGLMFVDAHAQLQTRRVSPCRITISTKSSEFGTPSLGRYQLAPWGQDQWIE